MLSKIGGWRYMSRLMVANERDWIAQAWWFNQSTHQSPEVLLFPGVFHLPERSSGISDRASRSASLASSASGVACQTWLASRNSSGPTLRRNIQKSLALIKWSEQKKYISCIALSLRMGRCILQWIKTNAVLGSTLVSRRGQGDHPRRVQDIQQIGACYTCRLQRGQCIQSWAQPVLYQSVISFKSLLQPQVWVWKFVSPGFLIHISRHQPLLSAKDAPEYAYTETSTFFSDVNSVIVAKHIFDLYPSNGTKLPQREQPVYGLKTCDSSDTYIGTTNQTLTSWDAGRTKRLSAKVPNTHKSQSQMLIHNCNQEWGRCNLTLRTCRQQRCEVPGRLFVSLSLVDCTDKGTSTRFLFPGCVYDALESQLLINN